MNCFDCVISVSGDYTRKPTLGCMYHGEKSGEEFCERFLLPAVDNHKGGYILIDLDETYGYSTAWLRGAFETLIKLRGKGVRRYLVFKTKEEPHLINEIDKIMDGVM